MEHLLARERAAEQNVQSLLKDTSKPIASLIPALDEYRTAWFATIFADHAVSSEKKESRLWQMHTEAKRYFHKALSEARRNAQQAPVALREVTKLYLQFIKHSERFYREYIFKIHVTYGGVPELEAVALKVKADGAGESLQPAVSPEQRKLALDSCHRTLIFIGDLLRYRGSEKLDKKPDFGPAIGFYDLACTLRPTSGLGHHQRAVIALEQKHHLRAIYHLYRAIVVEEPHPNAANNLKLEFDKTNAAWGELVHKGSPGDPDAAKNNLVGWFVRLHSMCFGGQTFRGYEELEREVLSQLATVVKQRELNGTLSRMLTINMASQLYATDRFTADPSDSNQNAVLQFLRINIKSFTTLLNVFYEDLKSAQITPTADDDDVDLSRRLTPISRRLLPSLRLYGLWLLPSTPVLDGVANYDSLQGAISNFWPIYAKTIDLLAAIFPIWDLDDLPQINYLLEEEADTIGFKPLVDDKTKSTWTDKQSGLSKPRWSDLGVARVTEDDEMLTRIKVILADGVSLATYDDQAPLKMQGMRILHRDAEDVVMLAIEAPKKKSSEPVARPNGIMSNAVQPPQPTSYAAAARSAATSQTRAKQANGTTARPATSRHAQMTRMVNDLVEDSESNNPVTPPQQHLSSPVVVSNGDARSSALQGSTADFAHTPTAYQPRQKPIGGGSGMTSPPGVRTPWSATRNYLAERPQSVSALWNNGTTSSMSPNFPSGLPTGTLGSPAQVYRHGHSRMNSASSIRSRASQGVGMGGMDAWSPMNSASKTPNGAPGVQRSGMTSPMLFGLGGGPWSNGPTPGYMNISPPNGQGG